MSSEHAPLRLNPTCLLDNPTCQVEQSEASRSLLEMHFPILAILHACGGLLENQEHLRS